MNGIFIGRFQPLHSGHISALAQASTRCKTLLILVGSSNVCRSIKNPWTYHERVHLIEKAMRTAGVKNYIIAPLNDYPYNDSQWVSDVTATVENYFKTEPVILFGHMKEGNDYLKWFPTWKFQNLESSIHFNATQVRTKMFETNSTEMPSTVHEDWQFYKNEEKLFANYPFPETLNFNCADAVVTCQGYVALIRRIRAPGRDAWALPGGFRNRTDKTLLDCAIRELFEETSIKVPEKVIRGSIKATKLYDSNTRSFGIPRNTLAVHIDIAPDADGKLPKIKAADDASAAQWVSVYEAVNYFNIYDDHAHIISDLTNVVPLPAYLTRQ